LRKLILLSISVLLALGMAGAASAAPLNWEGTSTLLLGDFAPTNIPGGGVATVNGSGGVGHLNTLRFAASRGNVVTDFTLLVTDPFSDIALVQFFDVQAGTGTFGPNISGAVKSTFTPGGAPGVLGPGLGTLPLGGVVRLCLFNINCNNVFSLILSTTTPMGDFNAVGVGGEIGGGSLLIGVSVQGAPWTVKTVTLADQIETTGGNFTLIPVTFKGFAHGPASMTTSTAQPGGVLQLVTPSQVVTTILSGTNKKIASGNIFLINFIPEPGLLLLLGSGVIGLVVLGRTRMHK